MEKDLKRNIDEMLDVVYNPTGLEAPPKTLASVNAVFSHIKKVGGDIRTNKRHCKNTPTRDGIIEDAMYLD